MRLLIAVGSALITFAIVGPILHTHLRDVGAPYRTTPAEREARELAAIRFGYEKGLAQCPDICNQAFKDLQLGVR